jgi:hypothetical protein
MKVKTKISKKNELIRKEKNIESTNECDLVHNERH